jgi:uncharacterized protein GlcG (DUF336 family)
MIWRFILGMTLGIGLCKPGAAAADCSAVPDANKLKEWLTRAPNESGDAGGLFHGKREWAVVVNRAGEVCAIAESDPGQVWPASMAIAKAKAFTANGFSIDSKPLSTARLYTLTQPGHSLFGAGSAAPFNAGFLTDKSTGNVEGGAIVFGGGVPLYKGGRAVGGLGVSGDTSCADHEIAKRIRKLAGMEPPGGTAADDILYADVDKPSVYAHPVCENTFRDGKFIGNEATGAAPATVSQGSAVKPVQQSRRQK